VIAIDADDWMGELLRRSTEFRSAAEAEVKVICAALSSQPGLASFSIASRGRAANYLTKLGDSTQTGGARETRLVVTTTLDMIASQTRRPKVLKIDVEQAELLALQGATEVLTRDRPVILCEVDSRHSAEVRELLGHHEYALFSADSGYRGVDSPEFNTVACPKERIAEFPVLQAR
jgi:FkbM family methyltransferase